MSEKYLTKLEAYPLVFFGAIFGALIVAFIFTWAARNDVLCVGSPIDSAKLRCVVFSDDRNQ